MNLILRKWRALYSLSDFYKLLLVRSNRKGQALVEFTLVFLLLLVVAWIPADFGLAFFSGQLASHAAREGARIAAASPTLATFESCTLPCSSASDILKRVSYRVSSALLPGATITLDNDTTLGTCNTQVVVQVSGTYNFFFYRLLHLMGVGNSTNLDTTNIVRTTKMRWEHQC